MKKLEIGDIIQDNDPRMPNRKLIVDSFQFDGAYAFCRPLASSSRLFKIRTNRIYTDAKIRRNGFRRIM